MYNVCKMSFSRKHNSQFNQYFQININTSCSLKIYGEKLTIYIEVFLIIMSEISKTRERRESIY